MHGGNNALIVQTLSDMADGWTIVTPQAVALVEQRPGLKVAAVSRSEVWSLIAAAGNLEALRRGSQVVFLVPAPRMWGWGGEGGEG